MNLAQLHQVRRYVAVPEQDVEAHLLCGYALVDEIEEAGTAWPAGAVLMRPPSSERVQVA